MKFGDMHYGQWFKECGGDRVFVKIQNVLPSGIRVMYRKFTIASIPNGEDARHAIPGDDITGLAPNAIDQDGIPGSCPDWLEFEIIDPPFEQKVKHHGESIVGGCCACHTHKSEEADGR
jgi:hypothetical protein